MCPFWDFSNWVGSCGDGGSLVLMIEVQDWCRLSWSSARPFLRTSSQEVVFAFPDRTSLSRRAISSCHAASAFSSTLRSRLSIRLPARSARSLSGRARAFLSNSWASCIMNWIISRVGSPSLETVVRPHFSLRSCDTECRDPSLGVLGFAEDFAASGWRRWRRIRRSGVPDSCRNSLRRYFGSPAPGDLSTASLLRFAKKLLRSR